ncbi:MAG: hypothetical protein CFE23_14810 [Flavobacterium sp. BFFFF1]|uniref:hypothetical protein n=1 Tax=Flavobacterium sp. BFFFF1 TaxID=2015557 RepID=UPI000BC93677|nr:hypothetical protein [Flavobacterium sp. BFFFF1]OYU79256.1 MAG: hypothetical protein CFE23_14810 [Flavobacterium sp. BFFFF1]
MMKQLLLLLAVLPLSAQSIDVAETTIKVPMLGEEVLYYGLAEGDQLTVNFEETNGKELKEFEIAEYPSASKFMDYKIKKLDNRTISINKTAVYKFRLYNSSLGPRICKLKIQRTPATVSTKKFDTTVYWKTVNDTTYTTTQENYLVRRDTLITIITDQAAKVHSVGNLNDNKTTFDFILPTNTVAWGYYIGVNQEGQKAYEAAAELLRAAADSVIPKTPINQIASGAISFIPKLQSGEDIDFYINDAANLDLLNSGQSFYPLKRGKVINDYSSMTTPLSGRYYMTFINDNAVMGVTVNVKIAAVSFNDVWGIREVKNMVIGSRKEPYLKN